MKRTRVNATGTVVELDWDEDGRVLALGFETDRDTFEIVESEKGDELADMIGCTVRVSGWATEDSESDLPLLEVVECELVEESLEDEDEDEDEEKRLGEDEDSGGAGGDDLDY